MTTAPWIRKEVRLPYCKGCGHGLVLRSVGAALDTLALSPEDVVVVTDIGCVGLADASFETPHTVHTTHGRSAAFATGMAIADAAMGKGRMKTLVLVGDGGAMIGLGHLVHAASINADVTVLVHNNFLFGMTGGQGSAFSPERFVTATTPTGSSLPPLDLARVMLACRAPFVARASATDRDLADVIARAVRHPGFALVEVLELCTAYATRWNEITGRSLEEIARVSGYEMGVLRDEPRPRFGGPGSAAGDGPVPHTVEGGGGRSAGGVEPDPEREASIARGMPAASPRAEVSPAAAPSDPDAPTNARTGARFAAASILRPLGVVIAGSAGERVQSAAGVLAQAAVLCGLRVTQKNDNPVTQGSGFSLSEVILSPEEILYTGIEQPDAILVVSNDGAREIESSGVLARAGPATRIVADEEVALSAAPGVIERWPFRRTAGAGQAALAAVYRWAEGTGHLPVEALDAAVERKLRTRPPASLRPDLRAKRGS